MTIQSGDGFARSVLTADQATVETVAIEDVIEVGGVAEDESINLEAEELPVARTRPGCAVKRPRRY
jgi:hypothetical protein